MSSLVQQGICSQVAAGKTSPDLQHTDLGQLSSCTENQLTTWALGFATLKLTRGNYPHKSSPCRLWCRCEKFHRRLRGCPTARDKGFYLNVSRGILILGRRLIPIHQLQQMWLCQHCLILFPKGNTRYITTKFYTLIFILSKHNHIYICLYIFLPGRWHMENRTSCSNKHCLLWFKGF